MNTPSIDIKNLSGQTVATAVVTEQAILHEELMAADYVQLSWNSDTGTTLPAGAYITVDGERYSLLEPYEPTRANEAEYQYAPQFQSRIMGWQKHPVPLYTYEEDGSTVKTREFDWDFTGSPADAMYMVQQAIKNETGEQWTVQLADSLPATISLSSQSSSIYAVLTDIANQCETEWWGDKATNTLYLAQCKHGTPVALTVGGNVGVPAVTAGKDGYFTRFYVFGSSRNVTQDSGAAATNSTVNRRLTLDPATYPGGYIDTKAGLQPGEIFTTTLYFDDIYPAAKLSISDVRARLKYRLDSNTSDKIQSGTDDEGNPIYEQYAIWYFRIAGFDFDPSTIIPQKNLSAHFETGQLAGRDFELTYHAEDDNHSYTDDAAPFQVHAGDYEIMLDESEGITLPGLAYIIPQDGDQVILYNIEMPAEYTASARQELAEAAQAEIARRTADNNSYEMDSYPHTFATDGTDLTLGQSVTFTNGGTALSTRVLMVEKHLDFHAQQRIRVGNAIIKGNTQQLKEEVTQASQNIDILAAFNELSASLSNAYAKAQREMIEGFAAIKNMWKFDPDDPTVIYSDYSAYVNGYLSAKGKNPESGSTVAGASALVDLSDVAISNPQDGQILSWNGTKWVNADAPSAGLDEAALAQYLATNHYAKTTDIPSLEGYATQTWASGQFALKTVAINAGTGLTGGGTLAASRTLSLATVGTAGTYTKVTVDAYGRVTGHGSLAAGDIPALAISKITGLQAALDAKMDAADFEELFEKVYVSGYGYAIRAKLALYTDSWMSAKGSNPDAGSTVSGGIDEEQLAEYLTEHGYATQTWVKQQGYLTEGAEIDLSGYATQSWVNSQGFLKSVSVSDVTGLQAALDAKMDADDRADFLRFVDTVTTDSDTLYSAIGIRSFSGCYPDSLPVDYRLHNYGEAISFPVLNGMRFDLYANHHSSSSLSTYNRNGLMFRTGFHNNTINGWRMLLDEVNYNSYVKTLDNLTHAVASDYIQIGSARLRYDSTNNALYVQKSDGTQCGFYATGFVSTKGANGDAGSVVEGASALSELEDVTISSPVNGQALVYRNGTWKNETIETGLTSVSWGDVTGTPTTLAGYGITDAPTKTGGGASGTWGISITGNAATASNAGKLNGLSTSETGNRWGVIPFVEADGVMEVGRYIDFHDTGSDTSDYGLRLSMPDVSGVEVALPSASGTLALLTSNVASATKLQTARTIALSGAVSGSTTFDGSKGVTISTTFNAQSLLTSLKTVDGSGSGLDADTLDGLHANRFFQSDYSYVTNGTDAEKLSGVGIYLNATGNGSGNANWPETYGVLLNFPYYTGGTNYRLQLHAGASEKICYRIKFDSTDTEWQTLARTTDNVYSATRLQTARTIWGRPFDGTANVTGSLSSVDNITMSGYLQIGSARLRYDSTNNALYVQKSDGTQCGFYATGFVSAKGANDDGGDTEATVLTIADERNTAIYPDTYAGRGIRGLFRANATDGLNDGGTYHTVLHIRQWANSSGGLSHQLAFTDNGGVWHRTATSETAWGEWSELSALSGLGDVAISSPVNGQALIYRDGVWKNETVSGGGSASVAWDDVTGKPTWIPNTDGSGSGLDADLLDGTHKSGLFTAMTYAGSTLSLTIGGVRKSVNIETSAVVPTVTVSSSSSRNLSVNVGGSTDYVNDLYATYLDGTTKAGLFTGLTYSSNRLSVTIGGTTKIVTINAGSSGSYLPLSGGTISGDLKVQGEATFNTQSVHNYGILTSNIYTNQSMYVRYNGSNTARIYCNWASGMIISVDGANTEFTNTYIATGTTTASAFDLGTSNRRWRTIYSVNSLNTSSDLRLKDVRAAIPLTVAQVAAAPSFLYRWKKGADTALHAGSSAQYWRQALPQAVAEGADGYLAMEYDRIALAAAIATARAVETLDQRVARLEKENARLRRRLRQHKINV